MRTRGYNPILRRADAAYLASLLVPLSLYGVGLKAVGSAGEAGDLTAFFSLLRSDLLFYAGYTLLWTGIFVLARSDYPRRAAVIGLHAVSLVVVALATFAYQYFESTGTTMDFAVISFYITTLGEIARVVAGSPPPLPTYSPDPPSSCVWRGGFRGRKAGHTVTAHAKGSRFVASPPVWV